MNVLPVITRELRAQARQPFTYWMRVVGVAVLLFGGAFFAMDSLLTPSRGAALFGYLHLMLFGTIWILVPVSAADCLSRERREGTLGLLFLTPLRAWDIVVAKGLTHGLRATTLLVAVLPLLTLPVLMGGVTWQQAVASSILCFDAVCWALAAALLASATSRTAVRAMAIAVLLAAVALLVHAYLTGVLLGSKVGGNWSRGYSSFDFNLLLGLAASGLHRQSWMIWAGAATTVNSAQVLTSLVQSAVISVIALGGSIFFAAHRVRRSWQEEPPSARVQEMQRVFVEPVIGVAFLKRWMRRKLERNPIGWLEQRRWSGRLVTWTWFAIIISVQSAAFTDRSFGRSFRDWENFMAWLLVLSMAASSAGSFRRERETGVLELLLVSPLKTTQIIGGRLRGLWGQFLPSIITLLGIWLCLASWFDPIDSFGLIGFFATTYLVLPVVGLYYSVRCRHFISALVLTLGTVVAMPMIAMLAVRVGWWSYVGGLGYSARPGFYEWGEGVWLLQLVTAAAFWRLLYRKLETRAFPLEQGVA